MPPTIAARPAASQVERARVGAQPVAQEAHPADDPGERLGRGERGQRHPQRRRLEGALHQDQAGDPEGRDAVRLPAGHQLGEAALGEALAADPGEGVLDAVQQTRGEGEQDRAAS